MYKLSYKQLRILGMLSSSVSVLQSIYALRVIKEYRKREKDYVKCVDYLLSLLDENNIHLSEFDAIAFTALGFEIKEIEED